MKRFRNVRFGKDKDIEEIYLLSDEGYHFLWKAKQDYIKVLKHAKSVYAKYPKVRAAYDMVALFEKVLKEIEDASQYDHAAEKKFLEVEEVVKQ